MKQSKQARKQSRAETERVFILPGHSSSHDDDDEDSGRKKCFQLAKIQYVKVKSLYLVQTCTNPSKSIFFREKEFGEVGELPTKF